MERTLVLLAVLDFSRLGELKLRDSGLFVLWASFFRSFNSSFDV